ncbi:hypothetical protein IWZ03DRAFT_111544 [Phyllosticta citriasiana]|uniref:Uncharacterized protein n=1 Tax=Phyllosticta citriasiana TaxID=595635 RepID=A0ABR1KVJ5_9PEZI
MQKGAVMGQASLSDEYLLGKGINSRPRFPGDRFAFEEDYYQDDYHGRGRGRGHNMDPDEEEYLFQRALDRVRVARARGQPDVSLSHEELEILTRPRARQLPAALADPSSARPTSGGSSSRPKKSSRAPLLAPDSRKTNPRHNLDFSPSDSSSSSPGPPGFIVPGGGAAPLGYTTGSSRADFRSVSGQSQGVRSRSSKESNFTPSPPSTLDRNRNVSGSPIYDVPGSFADEANYRAESSASSYNSHHSSNGPDMAEPDDYPHPRLPPRQLHSSSPPYPIHPSERVPTMPLDPFAYQTGGPTYPYPSGGVAYVRVPRRVPVGRREGSGYASNAAASFSDPSLAHGPTQWDGSARMYEYGGLAYAGIRSAGRDYDEVQVEYDEHDVDDPAGRSGSGSSVERNKEKDKQKQAQAAAASASGKDRTAKDAVGMRERSAKTGKKRGRRK